MNDNAVYLEDRVAFFASKLRSYEKRNKKPRLIRSGGAFTLLREA
jgi:hypothetical protein